MKILLENKPATFKYFIQEKMQAGVVLQGWEVKSLRQKKGNLTEGVVFVRNGEVWLLNVQINPLSTTSTHIPIQVTRTRKLLLHKKEIAHIVGMVQRKGATCVPLQLGMVENKVKCQIAIAIGKKQHDKRQAMKDKDWQRDKARILSYSNKRNG